MLNDTTALCQVQHNTSYDSVSPGTAQHMTRDLATHVTMETRTPAPFLGQTKYTEKKLIQLQFSMASSADSSEGRILVVRCHAGPQTSNQPLTLSLADQDTGVDATERQATTTDRQTRTIRCPAEGQRFNQSINQSINQKIFRWPK